MIMHSERNVYQSDGNASDIPINIRLHRAETFRKRICCHVIFILFTILTELLKPISDDFVMLVAQCSLSVVGKTSLKQIELIQMSAVKRPSRCHLLKPPRVPLTKMSRALTFASV